jgi:hypothetical protein
MPTLYLGPFNAEAAWREPDLASLPEVKDSQAQRIIAALDELQFVFCEEGDVLLTASPLCSGHREYVEALGFRFAHAVLPGDGEALPESVSARLVGARPSPYAVVPGLEAVCRRLGVVWECPPIEVVQKVNSKSYSHGLALALGLFGAGRRVCSVAELREEVHRLLSQGPCLVKDPFGVSGKGALLLRGGGELERLALYLERQVAAGRRVELLVQPLYDKAEDFSCHFEVDGTGLRHLYGAQLMDNEGLAFSSVRPVPAGLSALLEREGYWRTMEQVARALAREGYRGPVCVDSMRLRDGTLVPLLEINARKSMGLLNHRLNAWVGGGLRSHLGSVNLTLRRRVDFAHLLEALRRDGLLYDGTREGLLPLGGNAVVANLPLLDEASARGSVRGRLYVAALVPDENAAARLHEALVPCLASVGVDVTGRRHG